MPVIAIDYTPAIRQQAGIGRIIRGQVQALLAANPGYEIAAVCQLGGSARRMRQQAPLPLHATPIDERNMVRHLASAGSAGAACGMVHRRAAGSLSCHRFCAGADRGTTEAPYDPRSGFPVLSLMQPCRACTTI